MKKRHMMVDLEALRLTQLHKAPLMNMGLVVFDENAEVISQADIYIHPELQPDWVEPEQGTLTFWMGQPSWDTLQENMFKEGVSPQQALIDMRRFYEQNRCDTVWFNGILYDGSILKTYHEKLGMIEPWRHFEIRDFKTIRQQYRDLLDEYHERKKVTHLGLQDSLDQVEMLRVISEQTKAQWA